MKRIALVLSVFGYLSADPVKFLSPNILNVASGYTISSTGYYVITDNVMFTNLPNSTSGITITSSNVVLDLNDKTLQGVFGSSNQIGINITNGATNVTIKNGALQIWSSRGISIASTAVADVYFDNLRFTNCFSGINTTSIKRISCKNSIFGDGASGSTFNGSDWYVENCKFLGTRASPTLTLGVNQGRITNCVFTGATAAGLSLSGCNGVVVSDCLAEANGTIGFSIGASGSSTSGIILSNCTALRNTTTGIEISVSGATQLTSSVLILNCIAEGNGSAGIGLRPTSTLCVVKDCLALSNGTTGIANMNTSNLVIGCLSTRNTNTDYQGTVGVLSVNPVSLVNPVNIAAGTLIDPRNNIAVVNLAGT